VMLLIGTFVQSAHHLCAIDTSGEYCIFVAATLTTFG
jgi:hypothetical protein